MALTTLSKSSVVRACLPAEAEAQMLRGGTSLASTQRGAAQLALEALDDCRRSGPACPTSLFFTDAIPLNRAERHVMRSLRLVAKKAQEEARDKLLQNRASPCAPRPFCGAKPRAMCHCTCSQRRSWTNLPTALTLLSPEWCPRCEPRHRSVPARSALPTVAQLPNQADACKQHARGRRQVRPRGTAIRAASTLRRCWRAAGSAICNAATAFVQHSTMDAGGEQTRGAGGQAAS